VSDVKLVWRRFRVLFSVLSIIGCFTVFVAHANQQLENKIMIKLSTSMGEITLELDAENAPITVENFLSYVDSGHYDNTIFHRVIPGFVIQGGGMVSGMQEKGTGTPIQNEADNGLKNLIGAICMARTNDPHSATAQFFINLKDNQSLDHTEKTESGWGYAVFGRVVSGMDVVEKIAAVETGNVGYHSDVPLEDVVLEKAERVTD
jgi:peptidyl-prolyl cis-trans isomerase B (cyclophilin B)